MGVARTCDGPKCDHAADTSALPEGWLQVTISAGVGDVDEPLAGSYDFATPACFDAWLGSIVGEPEPEKPKRKTTSRKRGK